MKKVLALVLSLVLCLSFFAGCGEEAVDGNSTAAPAESNSPAEPAGPVTLTVVTTWGGDDGNRATYEKYIEAYQTESGNTIDDQSGTADETFKAKVMTDFSTGAEPDVLFYFNGNDMDPVVNEGKVVDIATIRGTYPDYASNMDDARIPASPADGKAYAVPMYGYWEGMFANKAVLEKAGVAVPGNDYSWDAFLEDCQKIKDAGLVPVPVSLSGEPHYWFEYCVLNNNKVNEHVVLPAAKDDAAYKAWVGGLNDIKTMYEKGYLPENALTLGAGDVAPMVGNGEGAFMIDGSWKLGWFTDNAANIDDIALCYPPAKGDRKTTDIIAGLSSGWYITKKAWDDPAKQAAAVDFVSYMTSDEAIAEFAGGAAATTALKNGVAAPAELNSLQDQAYNSFLKNYTASAPATQDGLTADVRTVLLTQDLPLVCSGDKTAEEAIDAVLEAMAE